MKKDDKKVVRLSDIPGPSGDASMEEICKWACHAARQMYTHEEILRVRSQYRKDYPLQYNDYW